MMDEPESVELLKRLQADLHDQIAGARDDIYTTVDLVAGAARSLATIQLELLKLRVLLSLESLSTGVTLALIAQASTLGRFLPKLLDNIPSNVGKIMDIMGDARRRIPAVADVEQLVAFEDEIRLKLLRLHDEFRLK